jgi:hypothetical protein
MGEAMQIIEDILDCAFKKIHNVEIDFQVH